MSKRALAHVRDWVFDLDNTLYPAAATLYDAIGARMTDYIARKLSLDAGEAAALQERYFVEYGATVAGLAKHHGVDAGDFIDYVHDIAPDMLTPDEELNALIDVLPGRKFVFTNGGRAYARRVLDQLGLTPHFDRVCDIEAGAHAPKPHREAYARLIAHCAIEPATSVLFEDSPRNLAPAHAMGFVTVLVGGQARAGHAHVDFYADDLKAFLRDAVQL